MGHTGEIIWDSTKPDGTPRKLMDVFKMTNAGWKAKIGLEEGIRVTYQCLGECRCGEGSEAVAVKRNKRIARNHPLYQLPIGNLSLHLDPDEYLPRELDLPSATQPNPKHS